MHLHELLGFSGPMTGRQQDAWLAWLVCFGPASAGAPSGVPAEAGGPAPRRPRTLEEAAAWSKMTAASRLGG